MNTCPKCQTPLESASRFCGVCGHRLDASPVPAAATPAAPKARAQSAAPASPPASRSPLQDLPGGELFAQGGDPYIGTVLNNRFQVEGKLGEGGFGAVYKGVQKGTNRIVALKLLHPEMTRDKNVVERFRREGQVLCSLKDAHTVTTYDFDQTADGTLFIAMELLEGKSLHDVFSNEAPIPWQRMLKVLSEMCTSLAEAHDMGIVHRDLKPENVHLEHRAGDDDFVKILDFGIAKMLRGDGLAGSSGPQAQLTATGQTLGTLEYMSPEQLMGKSLDGRSDIYGMGVLAFELMTGRLPFPDAIGPAMLISAQLKKVPESVSSANPAGGVPPDVDRLVLRMLEKDRTQRFADVTELRNECLRILGGMPAVEMGLAPSAPVQMPPAMAAQAAQAQAMSPSPVRTVPNGGANRGPGPSTRAIIAATSPGPNKLWIALAAVLLVGGGVLAFLLTQ